MTLFEKPVLACLFLVISFFTMPYAAPLSAPDTVKKTPPAIVGDTARKIIQPASSAAATKPVALPDTGKKTAKNQGITDTVYYGADSGYIDYDIENKRLKLIGNAVIRYQDVTLNADSITYFLDDGLVQASGKPQLIEKKDTTVGETMLYNIKTKRGRVKYASAHMDDAYFNGDKIVKTENNELFIDEGNYTTCAYLDTPDYYFYGKNVKVVPNDKIISRPVVLALSDAPVASLPFFIFPLDRNRQSGILTPIWGGHPESGGYLDNIGYYFVPNDYMDFSAWARISEFRDYVLNGSARYALKYWLNGSITGQYQTTGDFMTRSNNWSIWFNHNQNLTPDGNLTLMGGGNVVGSKNFYSTYSDSSAYLLNQTTEANLSLSQRIPAINASANLNWKRTQNISTGAVNEDLPSVNFSLPSRAFVPFTPRENLPANEKDEPAWYNNIFYSYSASGIQKHLITPSDTSQTYLHKAITQSLGLSSPQKIFKFFTVNPYFNARLSNFDMYMDTLTYGDTTRIPDTTFDTLSRVGLAARTPVPYVVDTLWVFNQANQKNDSSFVVIDSIDTLKRPVFKPHNSWGYDANWNAGVNLSTILYGMFPIKIFNFAGIRHTFTPSISYNFVPIHDQPYKFLDIVPYDRGRDKRSQSVGISLGNEFQGKILEKPAAAGEKPVEKKFEILSANIATSYDFEAPTRKFSDLSLSASTSYNIVHVSYNSAFWMYDQNDRFSGPLLRNYTVSISPSGALGARGTLWEGDKIAADSLQEKYDLHYHNAGPQQWQASLSPTYTFSQSRTSPTAPFVTSRQYSLNTSASVNFTRNWSVSWSSTYNFVTNQFVDHDLHFTYDQDCWNMRFDWRPSGYNPGYYFLINIKKIPEIKWEQRG
jgi:lipopolysaccharide assembly outer membrane protein LptD (OstA)